MNYIYDIFLNLQPIPYDFYDWNKDDKIIHVKKIPAFKISNYDFKNIKNNIISVDKSFLKAINNKTFLFKNNQTSKINTSALFSNGKDIIAIKFNKNKINQLKSTLTIDDYQDIINIINKQKEIKINYKIVKKIKPAIFKTRLEIENEKYIYNELKKIYNHNNYKKLSYICLECFGKSEEDINKAVKKIKKEIIKKNDNFNKIITIFKTINQN